ncbi:MAG: lmo0937 family membrane protein [Gemmatimonadaceae bacterium]|nr:lmo0937 family membrane protein [Gemmatimonadaceae bacterium]
MIGLAIFLLVLWVLGAFFFNVVGGLIHILLVIAVVVVVWRLIQGRKPIP